MVILNLKAQTKLSSENLRALLSSSHDLVFVRWNLGLISFLKCVYLIALRSAMPR